MSIMSALPEPLRRRREHYHMATNITKSHIERESLKGKRK
jgi:hypothetical protein